MMGQLCLVIRLMIGGSTCGGLIGAFLGGLAGGVYGGLSNAPLGLDGALAGGGVGLLGGALLGLALGLNGRNDSVPGTSQQQPTQRDDMSAGAVVPSQRPE
jgi:hypothetical protein